MRVRRRLVHVGLRENVLGAWTPADEEHVAPAIFLEDDVEVSALWWHWVQAGLREYAADPALKSQLMGISLYTPDDMNEPYENGGTHVDQKWVPSCGWQGLHAKSKRTGSASAVLFGQPCSWGALYFPWHWASFRQFAARLRHLPSKDLPRIPCPEGKPQCKVSANHWGRNSWKRLMIFYMRMEGLFMVYPNLPGRLAFSTNHVEPGVHLAKDPQILQGQRARHLMPLLDLKQCKRLQLHCSADEAAGLPPGEQRPFSLPPVDAIGLYDFYCARQPSGVDGAEALRAAGSALRTRLPAGFHERPPVADDPSEDGSEYLIFSA